jgi:hypothetical protein
MQEGAALFRSVITGKIKKEKDDKERRSLKFASGPC